MGAESGVDAGFRPQDSEQLSAPEADLTTRGLVPVSSGDPASLPRTDGWLSAALAIHAVQRRPDAMYLRLDVSGHGLLSIDFRHHAFDWGTPLSAVPDDPATVLVETHPTFPGAPPLFALPGRDLDPLLWIIGRAAFGDALAPWLDPSRRYRIARWPDLSEVPVTLDQVRMTSMLGNGYATPADLAGAAGVTLGEAQRMLNAFALLGILRVAPVDGVAPQISRAPRRGLFSRLRERLERPRGAV